jgi:hypothetical protein
VPEAHKLVQPLKSNDGEERESGVANHTQYRQHIFLKNLLPGLLACSLALWWCGGGDEDFVLGLLENYALFLPICDLLTNM